jgi:hypothetical protein
MNQNKLCWGITVEKIKKFYPDIRYVEEHNWGGGKLIFDSVVVRVFEGDCGALVISNANYADDFTLKAILKYASLSGFSKIFATVVGPEYTSIRSAISAFKKNRFICVHKGKSNRNPDKDDYVFVKIIRNPIKKGY